MFKVVVCMVVAGLKACWASRALGSLVKTTQDIQATSPSNIYARQVRRSTHLFPDDDLSEHLPALVELLGELPTPFLGTLQAHAQFSMGHDVHFLLHAIMKVRARQKFEQNQHWWR